MIGGNISCLPSLPGILITDTCINNIRRTNVIHKEKHAECQLWEACIKGVALFIATPL